MHTPAMKRGLVIAVLVLASSASSQDTSTGSTQPLAPATIANGVLEHVHLGLSCPVPPGMQIRQQSTATSLEVTMSRADGAELALFAFAMRDYPELQTFAISRSSDAVREYEETDLPSQLEIGGLRYYRLGFRGQRHHQTRLFTWANGWRLVVFLSGPKPKQVDELLGGLKSLKFSPEWVKAHGIRVRISEPASGGRLKKRVQPKYTRLAMNRRIQGRVVLTAVIGRDGKIVELTPKGGPPELVPAAMAAASQWEYEPYRLKDEPVEVETQITMDFTMG